MKKFHQAQTGFTLIELIIVMVVLALLAVGSVQFISLSAQSYVQTVERSSHSASASIVNEKIARRLRSALPNSVRIANNGLCVEWIEIVSASSYVKAPILGSADSDAEIHVIPLDGLLPNSGYVAIAPSQADALLYDNSNNPGVISASEAVFTGVVNDASVYNIPAGFRFERASSAQRLYFVDSPQTICQVDTHLFHYANYGYVGDVSNLLSALPSSLPNRTLLASGLVANSVSFTIDNGSLRRNSLLSFGYSLDNGQTDETLTVNQEVQIRNVP